MRSLSSLTALLFLLLAAPAGAAVSTNQSGWLWGSPEPQGHTLNALELQGTTGYAAGDFGTLLRTNDGGSAWGTVRTGQSINFQVLDVIDADSVVIGSGCAARRTDDGGESFRRLPFTSSERRCARGLIDVSFPTAEVGYLLVEDGGVLRTADGGRSFSPKEVPGSGGLIRELMFRNANEGIATTTGGDIFKTTDGGDSWTREFDGDNELNGVLFTSSIAVAVGNAGTFLTSNDGGDTWSRPAAEPGAPTPPAQDFADVACISPTVCLVTSRLVLDAKVFRTSDGGRSFTETGVTNALDADYASATRAVTVGFAGLTHISNDGGASFTQLGERSAGTGFLSRVRPTSADVVHIVGGGGTLARTEDGGETWDNVGVATSQDVIDAWFPTAAVGYAIDSGGGLFRTENSAGSWSILETGADETPNGVFAPDASHVFLIGPRGVLRSSDSGETFERHTHRVIRNRTFSEADKAGSDVVFYGPRVIALSTNNGNSWRHIDRPAKAEVVHVDFVSSRAGYVLDTSGRVYLTTDRGRSWTELIALGYTNGTRLAFGDRRNGWLALRSDHPTVLRTTDGGKSWKPQILGPTNLNGIAAVGEKAGFATPAGGGILFTQNGGDAGAESTLRLSTPDRSVPSGQKITINGRLSPAEGGEDVEVRARRLNGSHWREIDVTPKKSGKFSFEQRIRRTMVFVAQWEGDANSDGDGTRPLVVQAGG